MLNDARACWDAALKAVDPAFAVKKAYRQLKGKLRVGGSGKLVVAALGKASISMTKTFLEEADSNVDQCLVIHPANMRWDDAPSSVEVIASGHPIPDLNSYRAGKRLGEIADSLSENDLLVLLVSGGGSALACAPVSGISFDDKIATNQALLRSGAEISAVNCVRKHISAIKGGRLAARASPARILALIISDVVGDSISVIASGIAAPDETTYADALAICKKAGVPRNVIEFLDRGSRGIEPETPKPGDAVFDRVFTEIIASNRMAIDAAVAHAAKLGYSATALTDALTGEARVVGKRLAALLRSTKPGAFIVAGGETTVTVTGGGAGGRCQELALSAAIYLEGSGDILLWAAGSDGIDGPTDAAGAWVDGSTVFKAKSAGIDASDFLKRNDSHHFFDAVGCLIKTGPTGANVMDLIFLIRKPPL